MLNRKSIVTGTAAALLAAASFYLAPNKSCQIDVKGGKKNYLCVKESVSKLDLPEPIKDLIVAQAALESNLIEKPSKLALNDSNLFGIKCKQVVIDDNIKVTQQCTAYPTTEYIKGKKVSVNAYFAHYQSLNDGILARVEMFNMDRYRPCLKAKNLSDAAYCIQKAGYATDPSYAKQLIRVDRELNSVTK